jgi:hypothetical protein
LIVDENSSGWACITIGVAAGACIETGIGFTNGAIGATDVTVVVFFGGIFAIWTGFTGGLRVEWV